MQVPLSGFKERDADKGLVHVNPAMLFAEGIEAHHVALAQRFRGLLCQLFLLDLKLAQETVEAQHECGRFAAAAFDIKLGIQRAQNLGPAAQRQQEAVINRREERQRAAILYLLDRPHVIERVVAYQHRVLGEDLRRQILDTDTDQTGIFLRRRRAVDFQHQPFLGDRVGHHHLMMGGQEMVKAQPGEFHVGFQQQYQRRVGVEPTAMQHGCFLEFQCVPGRTAKDRQVPQPGFKRGHQHVFLL